MPSPPASLDHLPALDYFNGLILRNGLYRLRQAFLNYFGDIPTKYDSKTNSVTGDDHDPYGDGPVTITYYSYLFERVSPEVGKLLGRVERDIINAEREQIRHIAAYYANMLSDLKRESAMRFSPDEAGYLPIWIDQMVLRVRKMEAAALGEEMPEQEILDLVFLLSLQDGSGLVDSDIPLDGKAHHEHRWRWIVWKWVHVTEEHSQKNQEERQFQLAEAYREAFGGKGPSAKTIMKYLKRAGVTDDEVRSFVSRRN